MPKGLGRRQRDILAKLAAHRDNPPEALDARLGPQADWVARHGPPEEFADRRRRCLEVMLEWHRLHPDPYPEWMTVAELADATNNRRAGDRDVKSTRRAVRSLEAAGLVETRHIRRNERGQRQLGVRLFGGIQGDHVGVGFRRWG
jgi:hypothetical protein